MTEDRQIHPTYLALEEALSRQPGAAGRPWAWLASIDPAFNVRVTQNWKYRGLPLDVETIARLSSIAGAPIERLSRSRSSKVQRWISAPTMPAADALSAAARSRTGTIWRVPIVPFDHLDLMAASGRDAAVASLPSMEIADVGVSPEINDKVLVMPFDVAGTEAKRGHVAIFRPVPPGRHPRPSNFPLIVKSKANNQFNLTGYDVYMSGNVDAIAVCYHHYQPPRSGPLWD